MGGVWGGRVDGFHGGLRKFQGMMEILCVLSVGGPDFIGEYIHQRSSSCTAHCK